MNEDTSFYEYCEDEFFEFLSHLQCILKKSNPDYKEYQEQIEKKLDRYPRIRAVFEDDEKLDLSKEEVSILLELYYINLKVREIETRELFFKGGGEAYYYFKKIGIIKD